MGRPWYCLLAVMLLPSSYSLLATGTAPGAIRPMRESGAELFTVNYVSQLPTAGTWTGLVQLAPPQSALAASHSARAMLQRWSSNDRGAGHQPEIRSNLHFQQYRRAGMVSEQYRRNGRPAFYNFATLGPFCVTASGSTSGSASGFWIPCAGTPAQRLGSVLNFGNS